MNVGFDAKRAYHNNTGLGFFSRVLITLLATHFPENEYYLFNPKRGRSFQPGAVNIHEVQPQEMLHQLFRAAWRSKWVTNDLLKYKIDIYHGPSHEIPVGLPATHIPSVVTMHDLFPEIYPQQYKPIDVKIYRAKSRYACKYATKIMAISEETKKHIIDIYRIPPEKIEVVYQSCSPIFTVLQTNAIKEKVKQKYGLPDAFFLHVGTIIERKNLLNICKAIRLNRSEVPVPLVVVGNGGAFKEKIKSYIREQQLEEQIIFLSEILEKQGRKPFVDTEDFPALYQLATAMIYPSYYEGFGMPIIEAMAGGVPVITSTTSCLPEIGGSAALYVNPDSPEEMAAAFRKIYGDAALSISLKEKGIINAGRFSSDNYINHVMRMYQSIL